MLRSIPAGRPPDGPAGRLTDRSAGATARGLLAGVAIVTAMLTVYLISHPLRPNLYDHFVWQASAWLEGQGAIRYPVGPSAASPGNWFFQDVMPLADAAGRPTGRALIPFPPLPALLLLPFVALWGLATNAQLIATFLGALDVGIAWWVLGRLPIRPATRLATTLFLGLGTVFWYAAAFGTTWFQAHVVAVGLTLLAIGVALGGDPGQEDRPVRRPSGAGADPGGGGGRGAAAVHDGRTLLDRREFLAGLLLGLACTARLTVVFAAPFLLLVGRGGWVRRGASAMAGLAVPILGLAAYNLATTGHLFSPVYDYLYHAEAIGYPSLGYHPDWSIEDVRYLPQNLALMLFRGPEVLPACQPAGAARGLFDLNCPVLRPDPVGMSLLLTSPGYLLGLPALAGRPGRIAIGATTAVVLVASANLMHFSQGWVQFGYRFSLDFAPFALLLVALGIERLGGPNRLAWLLIALSVVVTAWGVAWGGILGW